MTKKTKATVIGATIGFALGIIRTVIEDLSGGNGGGLYVPHTVLGWVAYYGGTGLAPGLVGALIGYLIGRRRQRKVDANAPPP